MAFAKRFKFAEAFSGDPYDVVAGLHNELDSMLGFMEEEQLYVKRKEPQNGSRERSL